ncbi:peptidoglycan DD-metalloendopeptidase family protein [Roseofilum sp. BLCC_M91]|uniref:Peptidoglycan DD-metalloendopeptidase family protein n=1 Tax=Roseofilum halophilum BLCC-M91 TaxID=3022259 RepID=A0ABT7BJK8_9CYAN|nr:peptidoglycan DD-metalloendopeptidase family protein [Roseofilum halophilum]MDJ1179368.1 peptidoglycan DD-metalloendopeptidase family protein [Roseofilum halophilum BLCC-M91]
MSTDKTTQTPNPNPNHQYTRTLFCLTCHRSLLMQGLGWLGALGLLSGSMVWTPNQGAAYEQDSIDPVAYDAVPEAEWTEPAYEPSYEPQWTPEPAAYEPSYEPQWTPEPEPAAYEPSYEPQWTPEPAAYEPEWTPEPAAYEPEWTPEPAAYEPEPIDDSSVPVVVETREEAPLSYSAADLMPENTTTAQDNTAQESAYIDTSDDFDTGATGATAVYEEPTEVVVYEPSAPAAPAPEPVNQTAAAPAPSAPSEPIPAWSPDTYQPAPSGGNTHQEYAPAPAPAPVVGGTTASGRSYFNTQKPTGLPGNGNVSLLYPLAIPAQITSHFGWRLHPIHGDWRLHSGTDMAAATGTHVLAALAGRVAIANFLGGYGLTVVLEHSNGSQETLYAHLSEVFVEPGEEVEQGTVIGSVGSTGHSTGPHLHFELRENTEDGWVAVDAGAQLEYALARLIQSWETASATPYTGGNAKELEVLPAPDLAVEELPYVKIRPM